MPQDSHKDPQKFDPQKFDPRSFGLSSYDPEGPDGPRGPYTLRIPIPLVVIVVCVLAAIYVFQWNPLGSTSQQKQLSTNDFVTAVNDERVSEVTYRVEAGTLEGITWDAPGEDAYGFTSQYVGADSLNELMSAHPSIKYTVDTHSDAFWQNMLLYLVPTVIIAFVFMRWMGRASRMQDQNMDFGRIHAQTKDGERPKVKFEDVAGIDEAVEELAEVRDFLMRPEAYQKMGAKIPRGVLLVGPPGTGKTLLAKAVAGEAGVPFFSLSGSDFVEMFVGVGASRVRDLFKKAKAQAPCIIFIDEIDAVGRQRGAGLGGSHDEREQTLNQLLVELDGFEESSSVILLAATNRPDILDPALLRPGRFDRQITVDRPDRAGREKILRVHAQEKPLAADVELANIAKLTPGFTGADLANVLNEAALLATRKKQTKISNHLIQEAMERVMAGPERKSHVISDKERVTIAYHESGHALVGHLLEHADPVHKISIISRGQALGYTMSLPAEDKSLQGKREMLDQLAVLLGGRVAEELFCDDITTGASNDLERASRIARGMVTRYGMSEQLGTQVFGEPQHEVFLGRDYANREQFSEKTAEAIDAEVTRLLQEAHERAREILEHYHDRMHTMARVLLERETVEGPEMIALLNGTVEEHHED